MHSITARCCHPGQVLHHRQPNLQGKQRNKQQQQQQAAASASLDIRHATCCTPSAVPSIAPSCCRAEASHAQHHRAWLPASSLFCDNQRGGDIITCASAQLHELMHSISAARPPAGRRCSTWASPPALTLLLPAMPGLANMLLQC
jgi:hypothetical protein